MSVSLEALCITTISDTVRPIKLMLSMLLVLGNSYDLFSLGSKPEDLELGEKGCVKEYPDSIPPFTVFMQWTIRGI